MSPPNNRGRRITRIGALSYAKFIKCLMGGATYQEIVDATGLHYVTVVRYAKALHAERACFIEAWEKDTMGRDAVRVYRLGKGTDAKRSRMTGAERQARRRQKLAQLDLVRRMAGVAA